MFKKVAQMTNNIFGVFIFEDAFYNQNKKQIDDYFTKAKDSLIFKTLLVTHTGSFDFTMQNDPDMTSFAPYIFKPNNISYLPDFFDLYKLFKDTQMPKSDILNLRFTDKKLEEQVKNASLQQLEDLEKSMTDELQSTPNAKLDIMKVNDLWALRRTINQKKNK